MKQSDKMSRIDSQSKKPINKTGRRTALTFRVVLLPFLLFENLIPFFGKDLERLIKILFFRQNIVRVEGRYGKNSDIIFCKNSGKFCQDA